MYKGQKTDLRLTLAELERFAGYLNTARFEIERIVVKYEFSENSINKIVANGVRVSKTFLPKIYMKLINNMTYQQTSIISIKLTEAEMAALRCVVGILEVEQPALNSTNEVRQLMMHIQF